MATLSHSNLLDKLIRRQTSHQAAVPNLSLTSQEDENISRWFREMDLHDGDERRVKIVRFRLASVEDFDGKRSSGNGKDGCLESELE